MKTQSGKKNKNKSPSSVLTGILSMSNSHNYSASKK